MTLLNFADRTGYGAVRVIWPYMMERRVCSVIQRMQQIHPGFLWHMPACLRFLQVRLVGLESTTTPETAGACGRSLGGGVETLFYFYEHKHKQPTKQEQEQEQDKTRTKNMHAPVSRQQLRTALGPFLKPTMREGARAHKKMDYSACSKKNG